MTSPWSELTLAEEPAVDLLERLGYEYVPASELDADRDGPSEAILGMRLAAAIRRLNPWISDTNVKRAIRALTSVQAASLVEANSLVHRALVHTVSVEQDTHDGQGKKGRDVRFIDFDDPHSNDFVVTRQFRVRGSSHDVVPDVTLFVNGIPLVVIECKSPTIRNPLEQGIEDMLQYQEVGDRYRGMGAPRLFHTAQILAVTCRASARYATVGTPAQFWAEWRDKDLSLDELRTELGRDPEPQDVLLWSLAKPETLLDITRGFVAFEPVHGRLVRKIPRYQQYQAVNKAVERIRARRGADDRGGVIWHTQGSGKSLTMLWLAVKFRSLPEMRNPTIVVVTDRIDLDDQITGTFQRCGFPNPVQATTVANLRKLLRGAPGQTILTTVQKFQTANPANVPVLSDEENVFVLVDEAHRTEYGPLSAMMRAALPKACFIAFTGTPIDKRERSTLQTFGDYIDTYTIDQSVRDGATVPIYYESRIARLRTTEDDTLDRLFDRLFADHTDEERHALKVRYANKRTVAAVPDRVRGIAFNILDHFEAYIRPNGFKAQVVAESQQLAVAYCQALRSFEPQGYQVEVVISGDEHGLRPYKRTKAEERDIIDRFKDPDDPLAILVVCDKLLTGFDAPVEQVMYLDANLREHRLLQAIARVNRPASGKGYGLVVDYWGVSEELQDALHVYFEPGEVATAMLPLSAEFPRLEGRRRRAMRFFDRVDREDLNACIFVLEPEDVRAEFEVEFRRFSQSLEMVLPHPEGLRYVTDLRWLGAVRNAARNRFRDEQLDLKACGAKVRELIEQHVRAEGVQQLLEPVSIFSDKFEEELAKLGTPEARASEMEHALRHEIHVGLDQNPAFFETLRQRLDKIIDDWKQRRIDAAEQLRLLDGLADEMRSLGDRARQLGLTEDELAFHSLLLAQEAEEAPSVDLARELVALLDEVAVVDWIRKEDTQREMRRRIKRALRGAGVESSRIEALTAKVLDLARARLAR